MPDMKTALTTAIKQWSADDPAAKVEPTPTSTVKSPPKDGRFFATTNNVTRETFNYVRDNPGVARADAIKALKAKGFRDSSVHSLLGQMIKQGLVIEAGVERRMTCVAQEYTPLKASRVIYRKPQAAKEVVKPKRKYERKAPVQPVQPMQSGVAALVPQGEALVINASWDADKILSSISIKQARALFDELKKIFGQ